MKMKAAGRIVSLSVLAGFILVVLLSCPIPGPGGGNNLPFVIPDTTKVLGGDALAFLAAPMDASGNLVFAAGSPALSSIKYGDCVVGGISTNTPTGIIRKVTGKTLVGNEVHLRTSQATLEEAVQSGTIDMDTALQSGTLDSKLSRKGVSLVERSRDIPSRSINVKLVNVEIASGVFVSGEISFDITLHFSLDIDWFTLENFTFTTDTTFNSNLQFSSTASSSIDSLVEVGTMSFPPIDIQIGSFPVIFVPVLALNVGMKGEVSAGLQTGVTQSAALETGVVYDGSWHTVKDFTSDFSFVTPQVGTSCSIKGFLGPQMSILLYGIAGPEAHLYGYVELDAVGTGTPAWDLYAGMELGIGVKIEVCSTTIADYSISNLINYRKLLASGNGSQNANWTLEKIADIGDGYLYWHASDLALDSSGNPHVAYSSTVKIGYETDHLLNYAYKAGSLWIIEEVVRDQDSPYIYLNGEVSIAVDPGTTPHVAVAQNDSDLMYYTRGVNGWTCEKAATSVSPSGSVLNINLVIDSSGVPHIVYHDSPDLGTYYVRYATKKNGVWTSTTVDMDISGTACAIAVDPQNVPHLVYTRNSGDEDTSIIRYARLDGATWTKTDIETNDWSSLPFGGVSIGTDSSGRPHLIYYSLHGMYTSFNGSNWSTPAPFDEVTAFSDFCGLCITSTGYPCIAYQGDFDSGGGSLPSMLKYAIKNQTGWTFENIDGNPGTGVSIATDIDSNDKIHIVYQDDARNSVHYARRN
jgi:hypothetical protein